MNKTYSVLMFICAFILLFLKLSDIKEVNTLFILEVSFYTIVMLYMIYNYIKLSKKAS